MMIALLIISIATFLLVLYGLACMNRGFKITNTNIDSYAAKNNLVVKAADKVVSEYGRLTQTMNEGNGNN